MALEPRDEGSFASEEEFQAYLFEVGALYHVDDEPGKTYMHMELAAKYAPAYFEEAVSGLNAALLAMYEADLVSVSYEPEVVDGEIEMNPVIRLSDEAMEALKNK